MLPFQANFLFFNLCPSCLLRPLQLFEVAFFCFSFARASFLLLFLSLALLPPVIFFFLPLLVPRKRHGLKKKITGGRGPPLGCPRREPPRGKG
jgi:hypothetical protein